jgi:hypothetical protein
MADRTKTNDVPGSARESEETDGKSVSSQGEVTTGLTLSSQCSFVVAFRFIYITVVAVPPTFSVFLLSLRSVYAGRASIIVLTIFLYREQHNITRIITITSKKIMLRTLFFYYSVLCSSLAIPKSTFKGMTLTILYAYHGDPSRRGSRRTKTQQQATRRRD